MSALRDDVRRGSGLPVGPAPRAGRLQRAVSGKNENTRLWRFEPDLRIAFKTAILASVRRAFQATADLSSDHALTKQKRAGIASSGPSDAPEIRACLTPSTLERPKRDCHT